MRKIPVLTLSIAAAGPIAAARFVGFDEAQVSVAGRVAMGVSDYAASAAGKQVAVHVLGTAPVESGGPFAKGDLLKADANGRAIARGADGAVLARALQASAAAGAMPEVLLLPSRDAIA